ncbi:alpha-L RNA-binding motif-containing protein [Parathielavia appendiculata]|uniref:Small ribosomal subunit protein uS4m n=1 Tax=Parathielavia appendiculata TaxID=2587402 RepID=A0AAN6U4G2_9PEZI|nr:alpha-L RNA-binding motif-containing protein [Parathielavia appendiculata]
MRQRRLLRFHGLKRPRVRQTWNKYNLFNLIQLRTPQLSFKTFFQQKWRAKSMTRGYHGEHIKEYQWERMFSRRPLSAVDMDPAYMARYDGSEQAAGRGSGLLPPPRTRGTKGEEEASRTKATPYMQMVFAPMERRLDIAIFRALFASSARQARQFVLHGAVTVNGKKMRHPGYLLNPGDLFQVDIERVMTATGKPKRSLPGQKTVSTTATEESAEAEEGDVKEATATIEDPGEAIDADATKEKHLATLNALKSRAQKIMGDKEHIRAKQKMSLRKFLRDVKTAMDTARKSKGEATSTAEMNEVEQELSDLLSELSITPTERKAEAKQAAIEQKEQEKLGGGLLTAEEREALQRLAREESLNPHDPSKPYATPWQPRDWMSPFAFIPRYLEVNQRICAAVYLRHPVARPGLCEVPTPFSPVLSQLAFNWYLRRR